MNLSSLIEAALHSLLVALVVGAGLRLLRVSNVLAQKKAWMLVLAAALLMPLVVRWQWLSASAPIRVPAYPWTQRADSQPAEKAAAPASFAAQAVLPKSDFAPLPAEHYADPASSPSTESAPVLPAQTASRSISIATLLWFLYLGGVALLLARLFYGLLATAWLWTRAQPVFLALDSDLPDRLRLRSSRRIVSPVALASGVVLPAEYSQWDRQKLRVVLAHEYAHILQHDFYLQTLAGLHAALFWFSPLAWWLKRKLSDLGEAVSDRAGLEAAASRSSYAQILLEFAALPRPTPSLGVAMAHSSNLSNRIERFLNESSFHLAFAGCRRRALLAVLLVPAILFATTALIRVEAAGQNPEQKVVVITAPTTDQAGVSSPSTPAQTMMTVQAPPAAAETPDGSEPKQMQITLQTGEGAPKSKSYSFSWAQDADGESHAFVVNHGQQFLFSGNWNKARQEELEKAQKSAHGNFLWFTLGGKSYIVDDPAVTAEIEKMYGSGKMTMEIQNGGDPAKTMVITVDPEKAAHPDDLSKKMEEVNQALAKLQTKLGSKSSLQEMDDLQKKLADLQEQLSVLKGKTLTLQSEVTNEKGEIKRQKMVVEARREAQIGIEIQNKEKIDEQLKSIIEQSLKDNKARPVE